MSSWANRLVALNAVMFGWQQMDPRVYWRGAQDDLMIKYLGGYHRLFTSMLLHAGLMHLVSNSLGLLWVGGDVESKFGAKSFLPLYVFSGFCGNALSYAIGPPKISVGASGAIYGLIGALGFFYYRHRRLGDEMKDDFRFIAKVGPISSYSINLSSGGTS
jgi:membrane associated rhomboid family serine protease